MADDKLKTGPESPAQDHSGGGPAGDAQAVTKPPAPEEVEGPDAGTGPASHPEQSVIPGMGKDAAAQPVPQVEAEKVEKSPDQDKKVEPEEKAAKRRGRLPKEQDHPQGGTAEKGPKPRKGRPAKADKAALGKSPAPGVLDKVVRSPAGLGNSPTSIFAGPWPRKNSRCGHTCPAWSKPCNPGKSSQFRQNTFIIKMVEIPLKFL